jgi:hypothetical protein
MDAGRDLDTADRYLNCKAVKYCLRAGNVARAETLAAMFTRVRVCLCNCGWHNAFVRRR